MKNLTGYDKILLASMVLIFSACTISNPSKATNESLVGKDDPIFDKRFEGVSFQQLELNNFWVSNRFETPRDPVPLDNYTFANLSQKVKNGVVNIYTLRVEEKEARVGISPNDLLPITIPIISHILDIIPFKVPIPFRSEGISLGSGFIINDHGYILTNAHVTQDETMIEVMHENGSRAYSARLLQICHTCDLALLTVEDENFFDDVKPLKIGGLPELQSRVNVFGFPEGGESLSVTSGIVSRIEVGGYVHSMQSLLRVQIDAAINAGNSGGPVISNDRIVGIAMQALNRSENIGYMVPPPVINHFLADVEDGHFDGFPELFHPGENGVDC